MFLLVPIHTDGRTQPFSFDKLLHTLRKLSFSLNVEYMDFNRIATTVDKGKVSEMSAESILIQLALASANLTTVHPDHAVLAGRLEIVALHRRTNKSFIQFIVGYSEAFPGFFSSEFIDLVTRCGPMLDDALRHSRDYDIQYSSYKTLERSYLLKQGGRVVERPQCFWMRVAAAIHVNTGDVSNIIETYELLSRGYYIHATPTLLNAGKASSQLSSCFMYSADTSTLRSTFSGIHDAAQIFMHEGGIGVGLQSVPAKRSDRIMPQPGIVPLLRLYDDTVVLTSRSRQSRPSALTAYLPVWHADVIDFINLRSTRGQEELRTRNIFTGLMVADIFMSRVEEGGMWSLFDPSDVPELLECFGHDFTATYMLLEDDDKALMTIPARDLWDRIVLAQMETGTPFMLYQDAINVKNNQRHLGKIHTSNLCTEIMQYTSPDETAVCTLASLILPSFVNDDEAFDLAELHRVTKIVVRNLDQVVDVNDYPTPQAANSARLHRAIGIGVQGLADVFMLLSMPYDSPEARLLNRSIFETIYHAALDASCDLARLYGSHPSFPGTLASRLRLQYDLWGAVPLGLNDFEVLKMRIGKFGLRNALLTAQMPTASTSQIAGVNDSTDPYTSNMYVRRTLSGEYQVVSKWLVRDLILNGSWNEKVRRGIIEAQGSIQNIPEIPHHLKEVYRTAWELPQKAIVDMAADRGPYICQSQSLTIYMPTPDYTKLTSMHFHGWRLGLKTGMYYLRLRPAVYPIQFGLDTAPDTPDDSENARDGSDNLADAEDVNDTEVTATENGSPQCGYVAPSPQSSSSSSLSRSRDEGKGALPFDELIGRLRSVVRLDSSAGGCIGCSA
ncbi:alpha subunit of ribonucleoside-diphosphate reductase [Trametes sanguinea]|nr:alpha subunit of ribonucleoside-diphosphate reductase [Trametes sanguinea]